MDILRWLTRKKREREEQQDRAFEASVDRAIREYDQHLLSEDMGFPGDPSWFCEDATVGDGHMHRLPALWRSDASYMWPISWKSRP